MLLDGDVLQGGVPMFQLCSCGCGNVSSAYPKRDKDIPVWLTGMWWTRGLQSLRFTANVSSPIYHSWHGVVTNWSGRSGRNM